MRVNLSRPLREGWSLGRPAVAIFDDWWENGTIDLRIREFWEIGRVIMISPEETRARRAGGRPEGVG
jgi:hypothetical protein